MAKIPTAANEGLGAGPNSSQRDLLTLQQPKTTPHPSNPEVDERGVQGGHQGFEGNAIQEEGAEAFPSDFADGTEQDQDG